MRWLQLVASRPHSESREHVKFPCRSSTWQVLSTWLKREAKAGQTRASKALAFDSQVPQFRSCTLSPQECSATGQKYDHIRMKC